MVSDASPKLDCIYEAIECKSKESDLIRWGIVDRLVGAPQCFDVFGNCTVHLFVISLLVTYLTSIHHCAQWPPTLATPAPTWILSPEISAAGQTWSSSTRQLSRISWSAEILLRTTFLGSAISCCASGESILMTRLYQEHRFVAESAHIKCVTRCRGNRIR